VLTFANAFQCRLCHDKGHCCEICLSEEMLFLVPEREGEGERQREREREREVLKPAC